ncbi:MAG: hypothetical protein Kow0045_23140 [Albidovulum sp.]
MAGHAAGSPRRMDPVAAAGDAAVMRAVRVCAGRGLRDAPGPLPRGGRGQIVARLLRQPA